MTITRSICGLIILVALAALIAAFDTRPREPSSDPAIEAARREICAKRGVYHEYCVIYLRLNNLP